MNSSFDHSKVTLFEMALMIPDWKYVDWFRLCEKVLERSFGSYVLLERWLAVGGGGGTKEQEIQQ